MTEELKQEMAKALWQERIDIMRRRSLFWELFQTSNIIGGSVSIDILHDDGSKEVFTFPIDSCDTELLANCYDGCCTQQLIRIGQSMQGIASYDIHGRPHFPLVKDAKKQKNK